MTRGDAAAAAMRLALFDLDHTLLAGDSDQLWCDFLVARGVLDAAVFGPRNEAMQRDYRAGSVGAQAFCDFYVGTLAGRAAAQWEPLRSEFLHEAVVPRIVPAAHALVRKHALAGELVVLTTATNRFITELTAAHLGIEHLLATECEVDAAGVFTGRTAGTLNMREGKVQRLHEWLAARGRRLADFDRVVAYSDSINDLPLLQAATQAIAVDPDPQLAAQARRRGWRVLALNDRA